MAKSLKERLASQLAANMAKHEGSKQETTFDVGRTHRKIRTDLITPNPYQPRIVFDTAELEELAISIQSSGLLQPITIRPFGQLYQIVTGERRFRAHLLLGKPTIEAIIGDVSDEDMATQALAENIARQNLSDFEIAQGIQNIKDRFPTKKSLAEALGIIREDLYTFLAFDDLPLPLKIKLQANPRLISRTLAKELKSLLATQRDHDATVNTIERAVEMLELNKIAATSVVDFVRRSLRGNTETDHKKSTYKLLHNGRSVGSVSKNARHVVIRLQRESLSIDQEQRLVTFINSLADSNP